MAPAVLESDPSPDVHKRQVVVERVVTNRGEDPPRGEGPGDQQEPRERGEAEVAENPAVDPPDYERASPVRPGAPVFGVRVRCTPTAGGWGDCWRPARAHAQSSRQRAT